MDHDELVAASQAQGLLAALTANAGDLREAAGQHHGGELVSVRTESYQGHQIVIRTTYEISVDGRPFEIAMTVDNGGRVHYHGLPTRDFPSAIDLVKKAIDFFPDDFDERDEAGGSPDHGEADGVQDHEQRQHEGGR
jgi:hypothetical protein